MYFVLVFVSLVVSNSAVDRLEESCHLQNDQVVSSRTFSFCLASVFIAIVFSQTTASSVS